MGEAKDDIHVCILCMRAIMNNKVNIKSGAHIDSCLKFNSALEKTKGNDFKIIVSVLYNSKNKFYKLQIKIVIILYNILVFFR